MIVRWFACAAVVVAAAAACGAAELPALRNGSMADGDARPTGWDPAEAEEGKARAVRDTDTFARGPASLRLESVDGPVQGAKTKQTLGEAAGGTRFGIRGMVRAEGDVEFAAVAVVTPGAKEAWRQVASFARARAWTPFQARITVPDAATSVMVLLLMHGRGKVWLDEVEIVPAGRIKTSPVLTDFNEPLSFSYLSFQKTTKVADGVLRVRGKDGKGGAGLVKALDLAEFAAHTPAIFVKTAPANRARNVRVILQSGENAKREFTYSLEGASGDEFTRVLPQHFLALSPKAADEPDTSFDPAAVTVIQVQGDWSAGPVDVLLDRIELVPAAAEMAGPRKAHAEKLAQVARRKAAQAEQRAREVEKLLSSASHPADGPEVVHVCAVAPDTLAVQLQSGRIVRRPQVPYVPRDGDEVVHANKPHNVLCWRDGRIVDEPKNWFVKRPVDGGKKMVEIGALIADGKILAPGPEFVGTRATHVTVDQPRAYRVGPVGQEGEHPRAVSVKCKPTGQAGASDIAVRYHVYLKLPEPLEAGASCTIAFPGVNTNVESVTYTHKPREVRSEAIHATQLGYRPSDPFKRAYLSLWTGTGGGVSYPDVKRFELLDEGGKTVYAGEVVLGFPADRAESIRGGRNHNKTDVYYLDFHEFDTPGTYRVHVPGIGVSFPLTIADDVWARAFRTSMLGFLSHRSGMALRRPFSDYERPRPMHPADGVMVFELDTTYWNGEAALVDRTLRRLLGNELDAGKLTTRDSAWGGYMDAGDWDRRSQHLVCTLAQLELADLYRAYFEKVKLSLPPDEATDTLPDVLNEALWHLECYRRLQRAHGGVGGGIESTSHPRAGEASWQESLLLGTFAPDPETSLRYAATAARAARVVAKYDPKRAETYAESATRAWNWANANEQKVIAAAVAREGRAKDPERLGESVRNMRALAAVELYRLTGRDEYHQAFRKATHVGGDPAGADRQIESTFAYACLPDDLADAALKKACIAYYEQRAAESLEFAAGNAFSITLRAPDLPVIGYVAYFSAPETSIGPILPRAYHLTGKREYLRGAVAAAQFSGGANPMNMTFTTGLGAQYPRWPLHVDSRSAGLEPPDGITVYGIYDPTLNDGAVNWVHQWYLTDKVMAPRSRTWPTTEAYVDLGNWPAVNEYTVHQCFRAVTLYWGYLAARPE